MKEKGTVKERWMYNILCLNEAPIPQNRCIWDWPWSWSTTGEKRYKLSYRWSTRQHNPLTNSVHNWNPIQCWNQVLQHTAWSTRHPTWPRKIPPVLFYKRSKCHNRPQNTSHNLEKECGNPISAISAHSINDPSIQD